MKFKHPVQTIHYSLIHFIQLSISVFQTAINSMRLPVRPSSLSSGIIPTVLHNACLFYFFFILLRPGYPKLHSSFVVLRASRASLFLSSIWHSVPSRRFLFSFQQAKPVSHSLGSSGRHSSPVYPSPPPPHAPAPPV